MKIAICYKRNIKIGVNSKFEHESPGIIEEAVMHADAYLCLERRTSTAKMFSCPAESSLR